MERYTLLYILGSGHCGSTLLDLLLNRHSQILGLGEIEVLNKYVAVPKGSRSYLYKPSDSIQQKGQPREWVETENQAREIPFWQLVKERYEDASGTSFEQINLRHARWNTIRSWQAKEIESWARPNGVLLSCLHQVSGARVLTDASKFPHRLYLLQRSGFFNIKVIHLLRHGCAVVNSYIRRYGDFRVGLRRWVGPAVRALYLRREFARSNWLQVRYEELATRPEETLRSICIFLGISFEHEMLAYRGKPYFGIAGNPMKHREDERIVLDEEWKRELSYKYRVAFNLTAGWLNRWYGY